MTEKRKITDTDTTKGNSPHKLLTNREIPAIVPAVILPVKQMTVDGVATSGRDLHTVCAVLYQEIVTGATRSATGVLKDPLVVNWRDASGLIPRDRNTVRIPPRTTSPVQTGTGPSVSPISIGSQNIEGPRRSIMPQVVRNADPLDASVNIIPSKHRYPTPTWSKVIGRKFTNEYSADLYERSRMNFVSDTVLSESPDFTDLGMSSVDTTGELGSVFSHTTRIGLATHGSYWLPCNRYICKATEDIVSRTKAKNHYNFKSEFETRRDKVVDQDFGCQNDSMSRPPLDSTPLGTNTTSGTTPRSDSIPVGAKFPKPTALTLTTDSPELPTDLLEENGKSNVPGDSDPDPSLSDSPKKSNSPNDTNSSK